MLHDTPGALEASRLHGVRGALYQQCMNTCRGEITQSRLGFSICKAAALSQDAQCLRLCLPDQRWAAMATTAARGRRGTSSEAAVKEERPILVHVDLKYSIPCQ